LIDAVFGSMENVETKIKRGLDYYTDTQALSQWAKGTIGIGPVISAGLLANIDFKPWRCNEAEERCTEKAPHASCGREELRSVGSIWRFAGLDPTSKWQKGQKRPWNASLKRLCWLIGESFVKVSGNEKSLYGKLYQQRKAYEQQRNAAGELAGQAAAKLTQFKIGKDTEAYKHYIDGHLPPAHIHERAKRWAVKVFLCHYFEEGCRSVLHKEPPVIYSIAMLGHLHKIDPEP